MEEKKLELREAAPKLFGSAFTKQAIDPLQQVETLHKAKGKAKKVFSSPCKNRLGGRGSRPYSLSGIGHHHQFKAALGSTLKN